MQDADEESHLLPPAAMLARGVTDFLIALSATALWAWPAARHGATFLRDRYDAQKQLWGIGWVQHALLTRPLSVFQANAFAPSRDVLAFSEPLIGYGVVGLPFQLLGLGEVLVFNLVCLLGLAFSIWAIARLAQSFGVPRGASLVGAMASGFGACQTNGLGYISFSAFGGIALVLLAWLRLARLRRIRSAIGAGLATAGLAWLSLQLFAFALVALAAVMALELLRSAAPRPWRLLVFAAGLTGLLLLPLAIPLVRVRSVEGFHRSQEETQAYSASLVSWLTTTSFNPGQAWLPWRSDSETALYPGTVALVLALIACLAALRRARPLEAPHRVGSRSVVTIGVLLTLVGILGSLGYRGPLYPLLAAVAPPLFGGIRAAARFASVAQVGFGLLAALGLARLLESFRPRVRKTILAIALVFVLVETRQSVALSARPEIPYPRIEQLLAQADVGGPILHMPLSFGASEARLLVASMAHFKPIVNGTLSYVPRRHEELAALLDSSPVTAGTMDVLERWPVAAIVLHEHATSLERLPATLEFLGAAVTQGRLSSPLRIEHRGGVDWLFGVVAVRGSVSWGTPVEGDPESNRREFLSMATLSRAPGTPVLPTTEDPSIPASIDVPAEHDDVRGPLVIKGWVQTRLGPGRILEALLDGDRRRGDAERRTPRPDVAAAIPGLGDCSGAGYELTFPFLPGDEGSHELRIRFLAKDGNVRTLLRTFSWRD